MWATSIDLTDLLASLEWNDFGAWPLRIRAALMAALFAVALLVGGWGVLGGMAASNDALVADERALRSQLASIAAEAATLDQLRAQGKALEAIFADRQARLFGAVESAELVEDITLAAQANRLVINGIEFADSHRLDHYVELPVRIRVAGSYHQLGAFAGALANLPRILTLHDFDIEPGASPDDLGMHISLKAYRPVDEP